MNPVAVILRAVQLARARGLTVTFEPGWETRGNGYAASWVGFLAHHTGTPSSSTNPFPTRRLLRDGRSDLSGPLCNSAGPADGSIHIVAAQAANHAGASGGRSMGPLPRTALFNPKVFGHEIDYAGSAPMSSAQYRSAAVWAWCVLTALVEAGQISRFDPERARLHAETSITGKWDAGEGPSRTIDAAALRRAIANPTTQEGSFLSALSDTEQRGLYNRVIGFCRQRWYVLVDGAPREVREGTPNAIAATALDTLDGNFLVQRAAAAEAAARAAGDAAAKATAPAIDYDRLASALVRQGVGAPSIDYDLLARAVNDDAARRMES